jgi:hypothetical protein
MRGEVPKSDFKGVLLGAGLWRLMCPLLTPAQTHGVSTKVPASLWPVADGDIGTSSESTCATCTTCTLKTANHVPHGLHRLAVLALCTHSTPSQEPKLHYMQLQPLQMQTQHCAASASDTCTMACTTSRKRHIHTLPVCCLTKSTMQGSGPARRQECLQQQLSCAQHARNWCCAAALNTRCCLNMPKAACFRSRLQWQPNTQ